MSNRKYESGYEKLQKKRKIEKLIQSQKGALDKFITSDKQDTIENINKNIIIEQTNIKELEDNEVMNNEQINDQTCNEENNNEQHNKILDENIINKESKELNQNSNLISINIYDPGRWKNIDTKLIELLVERGPIREHEINFPKDENSRHFSTTFYIRK